MRVVDNDGKPGPLVDAEGYIFGVLGGQPRDDDWVRDVAIPAAQLMEEAGQQLFDRVFHGVYYGTRKQEQRSREKAGLPPPRRGTDRTATTGYSMGGGQQFPTTCFNTVIKTVVLAGLLAQKPFRRIAGFTNTLLKCYAPDLHTFYSQTMDHIHDWNPNLRRNFSATVSVFATATFNFGPQTVTFPHLNFANLAWGWCAITALGDFDPNKGGHLILWDLKLIICFPPGSTILIPSALIRHSNTSIGSHEKRFSFTQYTPAGIFRFVDNGFRSEEEVNSTEMSAEERAARVEARKTRWAEGLKMYQKCPTLLP
ncbi:hypothetical protein DFH08DRAFT_978162 [Mycena albidolilacea]|uniref:Uncharacterized protein n=1 Tax=Mycena albidolilacea TaxID=1033008 RepID=A0AAD7E686_9AGAR|nr:hypothetical protein DFH08DRAFT_979727 [Mycena albidolilacea]KAJ7302173.1 hypothetical protein DFH08DRAFT_978162 [Mycena albidolilacea]